MFKALGKYRLMFKEKAITPRDCFYILKRNISPLRWFLNPKAFKVMMAVTYKCQCSCDYCGISGYDATREELGTLAFKAVIEDIAKLPYPLICLSFFGGEPLLRQDLFELIDFAKKRGLLCELDSNGILLDRLSLRRLKAIGLNHIFISLDNTDAEKHDKIKGKAGCFKAAVDSINNAIDIGLSCSVSVCATSQNIRDGEIEKIIEMAKRLGVKSVRLLSPVSVEEWVKGINVSDMHGFMEKRELNKFLVRDFVYWESTKYDTPLADKRCAVLDRDFFYISPYGDIQPCPYFPVAFGNIKKECLGTIIKRMWNELSGKCSNNGCLANNQNTINYFIKHNRSKQLPVLN